MNELHRLAEFAAETRYEDIPPEVVERAKWVLRDTVGVIAAGMQEAEVRALADFACRHHPGGASLIGQVCKTSPAWAVLVHGTSGTTLELDEGHAFARGHAAIHSIPPAVALAEVHDVSGKELIAAVGRDLLGDLRKAFDLIAGGVGLNPSNVDQSAGEGLFRYAIRRAEGL